MAMMPDAHPLVRRAVVALDAFGATTVPQARTLIGMWARRDDFSDAQVAEVISYHDDDRDPTGYGYSRDRDEPTCGPLPPRVEGVHVGGRHCPAGGVR